jgi:hypothetical protein
MTWRGLSVRPHMQGFTDLLDIPLSRKVGCCNLPSLSPSLPDPLTPLTPLTPSRPPPLTPLPSIPYAPMLRPSVNVSSLKALTLRRALPTRGLHSSTYRLKLEPVPSPT